MFKYCSLYSGSSGNSFFVQSDTTNLIIDAGVSLKKIDTALEKIVLLLYQKNIIYLYMQIKKPGLQFLI